MLTSFYPEAKILQSIAVIQLAIEEMSTNITLLEMQVEQLKSKKKF